MGELTGRQLLALWTILTVGVLLRVLGLGWGLPPADPETAASGYRSSYALDEDNVLFALARTDPAQLDLDPESYVWGTLHLELTLLALEAAEAAGEFSGSWRSAFLEMRPGGFGQVYAIGRLTTAVIDLATVFLCFLLGMRLRGPQAGLWAGALAAVAPGLVLQACQIRVDPTAALLATAAALAFAAGARPAGVGLLGGLACAAKYSVALQAAALCWAAARGRGRRAWIGTAAAALVGFVVGTPFVLSNPVGVWAQVGGLLADQGAAWGEAPNKAEVLLWTAADFVRFGLGVPAGLLAVRGLAEWSRGDAVERGLALAFGAGFLAALAPAWPFLRYQAPFLPLGAVAAGCVLSGMGRWRFGVGAAALLVAGLTSVRLVEARLAPHPANLAMSVIRRSAQPGDRVARLFPELPPLDPEKYPLEPNPMLDDLAADPPEWVLLSSMAASPYPQANLDLLERDYERLAVFRPRPLWLWTTLGEGRTPLDWKYLRLELTLYRRR